MKIGQPGQNCMRVGTINWESNLPGLMKNENWAAWPKLHAGGDDKLGIEFAWAYISTSIDARLWRASLLWRIVNGVLAKVL